MKPYAVLRQGHISKTSAIFCGQIVNSVVMDEAPRTQKSLPNQAALYWSTQQIRMFIDQNKLESTAKPA